ncbi:MAG: hypothetical protein ABI741_09195 [Ferruginibacter sp.]
MSYKSYKGSLKNIKGLFISFFTILIIFACTDTTQKNIEQKNDTIPVIHVLTKPASSFTDTLIINAVSAVFFNPDPQQLEKIRASIKNPVYESMDHDCFFQMRNARIVLKKNWPQVQMIETSRARFLLFIKANKSRTCIDLDLKSDMCGIFLFDRIKEPTLIDMMNVDTALEYYFKR